MGFDLIGRNIDESHIGDSKLVIPVHIVINGISYDSLDDYLESRGIPKNSIKFSCSNRNWHTIWEYVQYSDEFVDDKYKFIGDEVDFEGGNSNSGHFINEEKAISIFHCCNKSIELGYFNQYIKERCSWADDSDKKNILEFIERFMDFCKTSGGFLIL